MNYDNIIDEINAGMNGYMVNDMLFMLAKIEEYKDCEDNKKIAHTCIESIIEGLPAYERGVIESLLQNDNYNTKTLLELAEKSIVKEDYEFAFLVITILIIEIQCFTDYFKYYKSGYKNFTSFFEGAMYAEYIGGEMLDAPEPYSSIFQKYGELLYRFGDYESARVFFIKALYWNPVNMEIGLECGLTYKAQNRLIDYEKWIKSGFKYAYKPEQVAKCYCYFGDYFEEKKMWVEAVCCYTLALVFNETDKQIENKLFNIYNKPGLIIERPTSELINKYAEASGFPNEINKEVLSIARKYKDAYKNKNPKVFLYFNKILENLINKDLIKNDI